MYTEDNSGKFVPLAIFDCRGLELVACDPRVQDLNLGNNLDTGRFHW